jgi:hypothetical protein
MLNLELNFFSQARLSTAGSELVRGCPIMLEVWEAS